MYQVIFALVVDLIVLNVKVDQINALNVGQTLTCKMVLVFVKIAFLWTLTYRHALNVV